MKTSQPSSRKQRVVRQGDVLLIPIPMSLSRKARVLQRLAGATTAPPDPDGAVVLARGEVTGHRHAVYPKTPGAPVDVTLLADASLLVVSAPTELRHEEHAPVPLDAGVFLVKRPREFGSMVYGGD